MMDFDLANLYQVETRRLKEAVRRNIRRFPPNFMYELTENEYKFVRSQFATLKNGGRGTHSKYLPFAFTEQGIAMFSGVLNLFLDLIGGNSPMSGLKPGVSW